MNNTNGYSQFNIQPNNQPQFIPPITQKPKDEFTKLDFVFSVIIFILGFVFTKFVLFNLYGFISTAFYLLTIITALIYIRKKGFKVPMVKMLFAVTLMVFSLVFSITDNSFIKHLNSFFLIASILYLVFSICTNINKVTKTFFGDIFVAAFAPFYKYGAGAKAIFSIKQKGASKNILYVVIGIICTLPLTSLVASLLRRADDKMADIIDSIFGNLAYDICSNLLIFVLSIPISLYIFGMLYANTTKDTCKPVNAESFEIGMNTLKFIPNAFSYAFVTPICILYALYFGLQLNYFVSAFMNVLPEGFTYAQYARQGFFELFTICIINTFVLIGINTFSKNSGSKKTFVMKFYNTIICIFTITLIITALSKMFMYISRYGLTSLRLYTSWFMILLLICFVAVILKQIITKLNLTKALCVIFVTCFFVLSFSCPDALIATHNINMYKEGKVSELDVQTLTYLSNDAWAVMLENEDVILENVENYPFPYNDESFYDDKKSSLTNTLSDDFYERLDIPSLIVYNKLK